MGDAGFIRFTTCLDPRAEEFRPFHQTTLFQPQQQQQIYYPYNPQQPITDLHLTPVYPPPAHVILPPLPPPLPPPSSAPTRTLLLSSVPTDVSESDVRRDLEIFGDVRAVQMERVRDGIVTVHFYDVRRAQRAAAEVRRQHMMQQGRLRAYYNEVMARSSSGEVWGPVVAAAPVGPGVVGGHAVWAQFKVPMGVCGVPDGVNQGTIVVFNLDEGVNSATLKEIFEAFGPVKELRETPMKRQQRFIEFYDVRHASKALNQMNGKEINGKQIVIEFSRPGGHIKKFAKSTQTLKPFHSPPRCSKPNNSRSFPSPPLQPPPLSFHGGGPNMPPRCYNSQTQLKLKKGGGCREISNGHIVNESEGCFHGYSKGGKKNLKNGNGGRSDTEKQVGSRKVSSKVFLKGRQGKGCLDPRFLINEERASEMDCRDSRTTVMIKNIPNKYSQKLLLNMLDNHCIHCNENIADGGPLSSYDFVYLPIDFINKCNVGYGFVNMTSPEATLRLYKAFHHQNWEVFNSKKICEVTYARLQGVEGLKEHFKNSKFPGEADDEYLPVVFSPPRDGSQLTEPTPIACLSINAVQSPSAVSSPSKSFSQEPNDDNYDLKAVEEKGEVNGSNDHNDGCHSNDDFGGDNDESGAGGSNSTTTSNGGDIGRDPYEI